MLIKIKYAYNLNQTASPYRWIKVQFRHIRYISFNLLLLRQLYDFRLNIYKRKQINIGSTPGLTPGHTTRP